jgi:hypothetical protein
MYGTHYPHTVSKLRCSINIHYGNAPSQITPGMNFACGVLVVRRYRHALSFFLAYSTYRPAYLERGRPKGRILNPIREKEEERHHSQDDSPGTKHPAYIWLNSSMATHSNPRGKSSDPQEFVTHKESAYRDRHCQRRPCVRIGHG